jgi:hypothetical protein
MDYNPQAIAGFIDSVEPSRVELSKLALEARILEDVISLQSQMDNPLDSREGLSLGKPSLESRYQTYTNSMAMVKAVDCWDLTSTCSRTCNSSEPRASAQDGHG